MTLDDLPDSAAAFPGYVKEWGRLLGDGVRHIIEPRILLGLRHTWDALPLGKGPCPGCGGAQLKPAEVCLVCLKSGIDSRLGPVPLSERPRPYVPGKLDSGRKSARKSKRVRKAG